MSATITQTTTHTERPITLTLVSVRAKLEAIVQSMIESKLYNEEEISSLKTWMEKFSDTEAAYRIVYLLCVYVRPKTESALSRSEINRFREFERTITAVLPYVLKNSEDVKTFILNFESKITEATLFYQKFRFIVDIFQKLSVELATVKHELASEIYEVSQLLNRRMIEINSERSQISQDQNQRISNITDQLVHYSNERVAISQNIKNSAQRLVLLDKRLRDISEQCLRLAQK